MGHTWNLYARIYDSVHPRLIDFVGAFGEFSYDEYEEEFVNLAELKPGGKVLDVACGGGRHALLVAESAARVVGIDRSEHAIDVASTKARSLGVSNTSFVSRDMRDLDDRDEYDCAYNFYTSWGYHTDEENFDVLARVAHSLRSGGRFLMELASRDALVRCDQHRNFGYLDDGTVLTLESSFDPITGRSHSRRTYHLGGSRKTIEIVHHVPAPDDLARLFLRAGFVDVELRDGASGDTLTIRSERVIATGRKP